jgi:hypothetical protein
MQVTETPSALGTPSVAQSAMTLAAAQLFKARASPSSCRTNCPMWTQMLASFDIRRCFGINSTLYSVSAPCIEA